jgi:sulfite dehydrogenase (cytochrome) subunit B
MTRCRSSTRVTRVVALTMAVVACAARPSIAQEPTLTPAVTPQAAAQAPSDELADAPGREKVAQCGACHSLDYIRMNSRFLDLAGWTAVVNKMIKAFGAPIPAGDVDAIARYLAEQYGKPAAPL